MRTLYTVSRTHASVDDTGIPSVFLTDVSQIPGNGWDLEYLQNTENGANLLLPLGIHKLKRFSFRGTPLPLVPGSVPRTPL